MCVEFNKCFFCIDLRTGCLIIGYLNLIGNIVMLSFLGLASLAGADVLGGFMFTVIVIVLAFLIHFLGFTIVLLFGLHQNKRGYVNAYLIYALIVIVLYIIMFFAGLLVLKVPVGCIVGDLISILLSVYFIIVIRNYYLKMDDPANKPAAIYNTA